MKRLPRVNADEVHIELCRRSLSYFAKSAWHLIEPGREYRHGWHIDAICEHLEAVTRGEIRNLLINMPPRCMKSSLVSVFWPAWVWTFAPEMRWLFASYAESLSVRDSTKCRRVIQSDWYQKRFGQVFKLTGDQNQKQKFENNRTGHRIATSVGGAGTGEGGDFIVCDDPHKAGDVTSETMRESVLDWWDGEMSSRGNDPKTVCKVIVMQRLHEKDLSGHVLEQGGYEHLCLPMEYDGNDKFTSIGWFDPRIEEGELLWPERFGPIEIAESKLRMGSLEAAGQLQQYPAPPTGNIIKRDWIKFHSHTDFCEYLISWDMAFKGTSSSDYCAGVVIGLRPRDTSFYVVEIFRERMDFVQQIAAMKKFRLKYPNSTVLIEDAANGTAICQALKTEMLGLIPIRSIDSKENRLLSIAPNFEASNIYFFDSIEIREGIEEIVKFPNARHDDVVDALTQGIIYLKKPGWASYQSLENFRRQTEEEEIMDGSQAKPGYMGIDPYDKYGFWNEYNKKRGLA